jgi:hypothetical protein
MEEPPSRGCQLGDRGNNFETWADCTEAHEQEPMKSFEPRSMMQEHHPLNQASQRVEQRDSWRMPAFNFFGHCNLAAPNINTMM